MKNMIYISKTGEQIVFDDFNDETKEYGSYWVEICPHCHNKYKDILGTRCDDGGGASGICSVKGCENEADYYVDFDKDEITITDEEAQVKPKVKAKVRLVHEVIMFVEGESTDAIQDWLNSTTPEEAKKLAGRNYVESNYLEEILCEVRDDSHVDYVIRKEK